MRAVAGIFHSENLILLLSSRVITSYIDLLDRVIKRKVGYCEAQLNSETRAMIFSSKLQLVFLVAILGTSYGAPNGYSYSQLDGPFGYSSPQLNELQINLHQKPDGPLECICQPKVGSGYPYSQIDSSSGYSRSQLNGGIGFGYPYPQSS